MGEEVVGREQLVDHVWEHELRIDLLGEPRRGDCTEAVELGPPRVLGSSGHLLEQDVSDAVDLVGGELLEGSLGYLGRAATAAG